MVQALKCILVEHKAIKREVIVLRLFVEMKTMMSEGTQGEEEEFGHADDGTRSIRTVIPHELERVEEEDNRRGQLGRSRNVTDDNEEPPLRSRARTVPKRGG
jgi:hypothetical protein